MNSSIDIFALHDQATDERIVAEALSADDPPQRAGRVSRTALDAELREHADSRSGLGVRVLQLETGAFDFDHLLQMRERWLGVLVLDGLLLVQLEAGRGHVGWLVGESDLLRPWEMSEISLIAGTSWRALRPARIALLDEDFAHRTSAAPPMTRTVLARSAKTAHWLLAKSLIVSCPQLEDRLMLLFALLGERWGKVTVDGILVDLPLTHSVLATLCGARRPSVTLALGQLREDGVLERAGNRGWLLARAQGTTPTTRRSSWEIYAKALGLA